MDFQTHLAHEHASNLILGDTGPPVSASIIVHADIPPIQDCFASWCQPFCGKLTSQPERFDSDNQVDSDCDPRSEDDSETEDEDDDNMSQQSHCATTVSSGLESVVLQGVAMHGPTPGDTPTQDSFDRASVAAQKHDDQPDGADLAAEDTKCSGSPRAPLRLLWLPEAEAEQDGEEHPAFNFDIDLSGSTTTTTPERHSEDLLSTPPGFAWEPMPRRTAHLAPDMDVCSMPLRRETQEPSTVLLQEPLDTPTFGTFPRLIGAAPDHLDAQQRNAHPANGRSMGEDAHFDSTSRYTSSEWTDTDSLTSDSRANRASLGSFPAHLADMDANFSTSTIESFDRGSNAAYMQGSSWETGSESLDEASVSDGASIAESDLSTDTRICDTPSIATTHRISPLTLPPSNGKAPYFEGPIRDARAREGSITPSHLESRSSFAEDPGYDNDSRRASVTTRDSSEDGKEVRKRACWDSAGGWLSFGA